MDFLLRIPLWLGLNGSGILRIIPTFTHDPAHYAERKMQLKVLSTLGCRMVAISIAAVFLVTAAGCLVDGAERKPKHAAYLTPESAGSDYQIQGEYVGKVGGTKTIAVQVFALGAGEFQGVVYGGGLPGAGWDGDIRFHIAGKRDGRTAQFHGIFGERIQFRDNSFQGTIRGDEFSGETLWFRNVVDAMQFTLKKVERTSPTLGAKPPEGAVVLFDGTSVDQWVEGRLTDGNLLNVGTETKQKFGSVFIHLEFRCPFMPTARGMKRGNSGVYVKREWEVQVLDSFGWNSENRKYERLSIFGRCGGIHEMIKPRINMSFPPLIWQTYDIEYTMAQFDADGKKVTPAMMSVRHNGVLIHDRYVLPDTPPGDRPSNEFEPGPLFLQNHGDPVRYRNIWLVEK